MMEPFQQFNANKFNVNNKKKDCASSYFSLVVIKLQLNTYTYIGLQIPHLKCHVLVSQFFASI